MTSQRFFLQYAQRNKQNPCMDLVTFGLNLFSTLPSLKAFQDSKSVCGGRLNCSEEQKCSEAF